MLRVKLLLRTVCHCIILHVLTGPASQIAVKNCLSLLQAFCSVLVFLLRILFISHFTYITSLSQYITSITLHIRNRGKLELKNLMTIRCCVLGVLCTIFGWNVNYQSEQICAVKGSTVMIPCSFSYPKTQKVTRVMWTHNSDAFVGPFAYDSSYSLNSIRFVDLGDKERNCSFQINQLKFEDSGNYIFRFETSRDKWSGVGGSTLKVIDLISIITQRNGTIIEGDMVNVTCKNSCDGLHNMFIIWLKNGGVLHEGLTLSFKNISIQDSGNYTCNLNHAMGRLFKVFNINVECKYLPKVLLKV